MDIDWVKRVEMLYEKIPLQELAKASKRLTDLYQTRERKPLSKIEKLAYLAARFPATFAVNCQVFHELQKWVDCNHLASLLDVGAGPGTALAAACQKISLIKATLYEQDRDFIELGKQLFSDTGIQPDWIFSDMKKIAGFPKHDLVIASYSLNELSEEEKGPFVQKLWQATGSYLILIEPGTPRDFESLRKIRRDLICQGGYLVAPCPHANECPLPKGDWCHFGKRLERSSLHRRVKGAALNYEDEKYFYLIFSKTPQTRCQDRVIKRPLKGKGFVKIPLCKREALEDCIITKKNKDTHFSLKKLDWGDSQ